MKRCCLEPPAHIAICTTRRKATEFSPSPEFTNAIQDKTYVDDYLSSSRTVSGGVEEAVDVKEILAKRDLHLQGWISN